MANTIETFQSDSEKDFQWNMQSKYCSDLIDVIS